MGNIRLIARMDIKNSFLIKGIHLEGLRKIGDPQEFAQKYYQEGIDEIIYMDSVASLYGRNSLLDIISYTAQNIFVPFTVGGGIRTVNDVTMILRAGADKIAINTAAIENPSLITEVAKRFGSQCMVLSVEAKKMGTGRWEAYTNCGRESTGVDVIEWIKKAVELGAGEILLTSIDQEGTRKGFDIDLLQTASESVDIPIIASGGMGSAEHLLEAIKLGGVDAVAMADILHYNRKNIGELRTEILKEGLLVRKV